MGTLNLTDIEGRKEAESEGLKVSDIVIPRVERADIVNLRIEYCRLRILRDEKWPCGP